MAVLSSEINPQSEDFANNCAAMQSAIDEFRAVEEKVLAKAEQAKEKFRKCGKLLPRERLNLLLDAGSNFLELCSLAGLKMHDFSNTTSLPSNCPIKKSQPAIVCSVTSVIQALMTATSSSMAPINPITLILTPNAFLNVRRGAQIV